MTASLSPASPDQLRELLSGDARRVAPRLLGSVLTHHSHEGTVAVRITEVEAYMGPGDSSHPDPGSHTFRGPTARNAPMFGPAGHLYVYFTYGMHYCANIVCGPAGTASAVLLRAGEVVEGQHLAMVRRPTSKSALDLASGPARLATTLALTTADSGRDALADPFELRLPSVPAPVFSSGPRVGVSGDGGSATYPWRFWLPGDPTVSRYKAAKVRRA
ncbi:DNA-3-methyladenine glycosylase [Pseudarthrobacter raffinosi]|uniref:DNA-3-methyladenine glycosylase n=1 Tax=Pseudarthrobacter raffinosi TaxID=2953651 RepID=UPI00208EBFE4|nr:MULTISPECIES: DNA-3-methyladenine glycosylase [unclassified Pseudarthrobacter]MCO4238937.1 DNA-3-methyladenine glycosylase [Pseudarthrobacter sp. MDT3-28]MCO4252873.1 DNA-3-methyladenine glycosylase [Pseudarthrobacter sp. MDT3-9]MCO4262028.1 DNA-3-methyladenine glycosylase [Pseudarthrobacter sp. MDT3-26]